MPALDELGLSVKPSTFRRNMMACTGLEFCKLAIVETKARGIALVDELEKRIGDLDVPLTININGCPNACARTQIADIGLKGMIVTDASGAQVEGFQVHLGGGLGLDAGFGRKVRGHKVTGDDLADYVERVIKTFDVAARDRRTVRPVGGPRRRGGCYERACERIMGAACFTPERSRGENEREPRPAQYCPYCGETNLWPHEDSHGAWSCRDCNRVFAVRFIGIAGRRAATGAR